MTAGKLFRKTMPFIWAKILLAGMQHHKQVGILHRRPIGISDHRQAGSLPGRIMEHRMLRGGRYSADSAVQEMTADLNSAERAVQNCNGSQKEEDEMRKLLMLVLAMMLVFSVTACGGSDESAEEPAPAAQESAEESVAATKTLAYFNEYVSGGSYTMEMKTEYDGVTATTKSASKGDMLYTESDMDGTQSIMIMRDGFQYILDPSSKTCIKMSLDMASTTEIFADEAANYETAVTTGTEEINGTSYDYEEFEVEGTSVKYYFDGKALKYITTIMEGESYLMEIVSMEKGADASLFDIPADYTVVEY